MRHRFDCRLEREARSISRSLFEKKDPLDTRKTEAKLAPNQPKPQSPEEKTLAEKADKAQPGLEKKKEEENPPTMKELLATVVKKFGELKEKANQGLQKKSEQVTAVDQKVAKMKTPDENRADIIGHQERVDLTGDIMLDTNKTEVVDATGVKEEQTSKSKVQSVSEPTPKQEVAQAPERAAADKVASADAAKTEQLAKNQTMKPPIKGPETERA